jgi:hypothetical protein
MSGWTSQSGQSQSGQAKVVKPEWSNLSGHVRVVHVRVIHVRVAYVRVDELEWSNPGSQARVVHVRVIQVTVVLSEWTYFNPYQSGPYQGGSSHGRASCREVHPMGMPLLRAFFMGMHV